MQGKRIGVAITGSFCSFSQVLPVIERLAREIDPGCFMIVNQVSEVWGQGFSLNRDYSSKQAQQ